MTWSTIRRATAEDRERLEAAAQRFIQRHEIPMDEFDTSAVWAVEAHIDLLSSPGTYATTDDGEGKRLQALWSRVVQRALKSRQAEGIAYDHVGFSV